MASELERFAMSGNSSHETSELVRRPARGVIEMREAILSGALTVRAAIAEGRTAIESGDAQLQAFVRLNDETPAECSPDLPLAGISIGIKDLFDTAGLATSYGSVIYRDYVPVEDAELVSALKVLGGHVAGKTVTTEFAWRQAGPTVNPWNSAHTPGGSSSGSAAAVAAGLVPLAIGTQTFGSVIRPAAFCGVVGFKPSHGTLPLGGAHPLSPTLDHAGFFARSVVDISHVFDQFAPGKAQPASRISTRRLRLVHGPAWLKASSAQKHVFERVSTGMREAGLTLDETPLRFDFEAAANAADIILCHEASRIFQPLMDRHPELLSQHMQELVTRGEQLGAACYEQALQERLALQTVFEKEMVDFDAVLTLSALGEAPLLADGTGSPLPCVPWTLIGVPAITLPSGVGIGNLPLGVQLVGTSARDRALLELADDVSRICSGHDRSD